MLRKTRRGIVVCVVGSVVAYSVADFTVFVDYTVGEEYQEAQENAFLEATSGLTMIHFDDLDPNSFLQGDEYADLGILFSQPEGYKLQALTDNENFTPRSQPNSLFPKGGAPISERLQLDLIEPQFAVGFWVMDSEYTAEDYEETLEFFDADLELIVSVPTPRSEIYGDYPESNFFVGVISSDPIARVIMNEAPDGEPVVENVGWDNVYFGVPEPSSIALLGLAAAAMARGRR